METLRTTFNNLVTSMKRYDLYQIDDEVGMGVQNLSDKIDEVYKRIECVINTNKDIRGILSIYADVMSDDYSEILERSVNDINIAMDLTDDEPISVDWYGLFGTRNGVDEIVPRETNISVDDVVKVAMELGMNPSIEEINEVMGYYNSESEQDPTATWELIVENLLYNCVAPSQQNIEDKFKPRSVAEYVATLPKEEPPTSLCEIPQTHEFVKDIIAKLKVIGVDGETMQYILEQVGMDDQMLRQLVMKSNFKDTKDLLREKFENEI